MRDDPRFQMLQAELGARLRRYRTDRGWTQEYAAERSGLATRHLQKLEAGELNVTLYTLYRVASAYEVQLSELLT